MAQAVGGEVDAMCNRCKLTLAHTILAMVGTKIARVRCNTCGSDHKFWGASSPTSKPTRAPSARATKEDKVIISFEQQLASKDVANAPKYSPKDTYALDQVLSHPTFGIGLVTAVRGDKIEVAFKADSKTLVHGRGGAGAAVEKPTFKPPTVPTQTGPADKPQPVSENENQ
jgi:hypothetical protein